MGFLVSSKLGSSEKITTTATKVNKTGDRLSEFPCGPVETIVFCLDNIT